MHSKDDYDHDESSSTNRWKRMIDINTEKPRRDLAALMIDQQQVVSKEMSMIPML
jgi:hypothetical protein